MTWTVGLIGLGAIGGNVAERLLERGVDVTAFDLNTDAVDKAVSLGAHRAASALDAASVDFLVTSLPSDAILESVLLAPGLFEKLGGGVLVELSTVLPATVVSLSQKAAAHSIGTVDAPFSGGTAEARSGGLVFYVGSDDQTLDRARPLLDLMGSVEHVGDVGQGKVMKLVNNTMSIGNMVIAAEALEMGRRMGLDQARMFEILAHSGGRSAMFLKRMPRVLERDFAPAFSLGLSAKDVGLALQVADALDLELPAAAGVAKVLDQGVADGLGGLDLAGVVKVLEPDE